MTAPLAVTAQKALSSRLRSAAAVLLTPREIPVLATDPAVDSAAVFEALVSALTADPADDQIWLLLTALSAVYPTRPEVDTTRRRFQLESPINLRMHLLDSALEKVQSAGTATTEIELLVGAVIVDVDHSAKHDLHTGIQRVSRNLLPQWDSGRTIVPAAWSDAITGLRRLATTEADRVIRWAEKDLQRSAPATLNGTAGDAKSGDAANSHHRETAPVVSSLLVPWRSVVVMVEVPPQAANDRLAALGRVSGNRLVGIAYDAIPVVSADAVPPVESMKFARYLTAVKFARRMAGISAAAAAEMGGFVRMLPTQGLVGPVVTEVSLPADGRPAANAGSAHSTPAAPVPAGVRPGTDATVPMVLSVGSHEPRKNHLAILYAAEVLWREGVRFSLEFIGGSGWGDDFPRRAADLKAAGRPVEVRKGVTDTELDKAMSTALFTVFPSLHEGYGLPVAESMAHGTPVITSNFGSMAEIAADGGALMIDPRDDEALTDAMRTLLTDPAEVARLRKEIGERPLRSWAMYADELWSAIVEPELADLSASATNSPTTTAGSVA